MTIKYSPRLKGIVHGWYSEDGLPWLCDEGVRANWSVGEAEHCWVALSDLPIAGGMKITVYALGKSFAHAFPGHLPAGYRFRATRDFADFLHSFGTTTPTTNFRDVWLWIEVPG